MALASGARCNGNRPICLARVLPRCAVRYHTHRAKRPAPETVGGFSRKGEGTRSKTQRLKDSKTQRLKEIMARRSKTKRGGRPYRREAAHLKREGGVCHLCGLPIDPDLVAPHPMSFSVDHVVPVSMGGAMHDRHNLRPAHRICNMKRGTGRGTPRTNGDRSLSW